MGGAVQVRSFTTLKRGGALVSAVSPASAHAGKWTSGSY
jgi:hypothetical protein